MSDDHKENIAQTVAVLTVSGMSAKKLPDSNVPYIVVPKGHDLRSIEQFQNNPPAIMATVNLNDENSFIAYVNKHKDEKTAVFVDDTKKTMKAVLDYHTSTLGIDNPSWCEHNAIITFPFHRQFAALFATRDIYIDRAKFVDFIEDNLDIFKSPSGVDFLEIAEHLQGHKNITFSHGGRKENGDVEFLYKEDTTTTNGKTGKFSTPENIVINLPIFHNGEAVDVFCKLRFRIADGKLSYNLRMPGIEEKIEKLFKETVSKITSQIEAPVYFATNLTTLTRIL